MSVKLGSKSRSCLPRFLWAVLFTTILLLRTVSPPRSLTALGLVALQDLILLLLQWAVTILLILAIGTKILTYLPVRWKDGNEHTVYAFAIGCGSLAYLLLALSAFGWLRPTPITIILITLAFILAPTLTEIARKIWKVPLTLRRALNKGDRIAKGTLIVGLAIGVITLVNTLTPPWDYDGLAYHLIGPRQFLEAGRLFPSIDNWFLNGPFTVEMLFTLGLAYGDDILPKLIHLSMGFFLVASTFILARRWFEASIAWVSVAILLGIPILPIWSSLAYIDVGWSLFEFLALSAAIIAWQERDQQWLILSGALIGFAMGSKYLGLIGFVLIGLFIFVTWRKLSWRVQLRTILLYTVTAILVASPWYIKNLIWFSNPVYPFYFGGPEGDLGRLAAFTAYLSSFGTGSGFWDAILLPFNIYIHHADFGTFRKLLDVPSLFFPIVLFYPFLKSRHRVISGLLWISVGRFILWGTASQQIRFLLPLYPPLAIAAAFTVIRLTPKRPVIVLIQRFLLALTVGLMSITLATQLATFAISKPLGVILGREDKQSFLMRTDNHDYAALVHIQENLAATDRVLLLGDGRSYYCQEQCISDPDQFRWAHAIASLQSYRMLSPWLKDRSISHILLLPVELDFLLQHDPLGVMASALDKLQQWHDLDCMTEVYRDDWATLYEVTCR